MMENFLMHKNCIILEKLEYDKLVTENLIVKSLNVELNLLNSIRTDNDLLRQNQTTNLLIIETLKNENRELKEEINLLKNRELKEEINLLKNENKELKIEIISIKADNKILKKQVTKLMDKNYIDRIIYACQDLNSKEQLEKKFKFPLNNLLTNLRTDRNFDCHLILSTDDETIILCKEKIFYNNLINLTVEQRKMLNKKIKSELVDEFITFLGNKSFDSILSVISNYEDDINEWFEE